MFLHHPSKFGKVSLKVDGEIICQSRPLLTQFSQLTHCACRKIANGRSPPVITEEEWEDLKKEVDLISQDLSMLPSMWLSATEGDKDENLERLAHWPETEVVDNETKKLEAVETVWRDFYTGQRLDIWPIPYQFSYQDEYHGEAVNCMKVNW